MDKFEQEIKNRFNECFGDALRETEAAEAPEQQDDVGEYDDLDEHQSDTDPDDFAVWSSVEGLKRSGQSESDDFIQAIDLARSLGFRTLDDLPDGHPLRDLDEDDFLSNDLVEQAAQFHNTVQPQQQGQSLYEKLAAGDSSLTVQQEFEAASPETKRRIAELAAERGGLPTDVGLLLKCDLQQAELEQGAAASAAAQDALDSTLSDSAKNRRHLAGLAREGDSDAISTIQKMAEGSAE